MSLPISTMGVGLDLVRDVAQQYVPPRVLTVPGPPGPPPTEVTFGTGIGLVDGQPLPAGGYWYIVSGTLLASGTVQAVPVTVVNGPTPP